jgi:hypothetical protein
LGRKRAFNCIVVNVGTNDIRNDDSASALADLQTIYNSVLADPDNRLIVYTVTPLRVTRPTRPGGKPSGSR